MCQSREAEGDVRSERRSLHRSIDIPFDVLQGLHYGVAQAQPPLSRRSVERRHPLLGEMTTKPTQFDEQLSHPSFALEAGVGQAIDGFCEKMPDALRRRAGDICQEI